MKILLFAAAALLLQLLLFLCTGTLLMRVRGRKSFAVTSALLLGYFAYFGLFEVLCLSCELLLVPLDVLTLVLALLYGIVILLGIALGFGAWRSWMRDCFGRRRQFGPLLVLVLAALALSAVFVLLYADASADSGWYVGMASTALETGTLGRFDPSTGQLIKRFQARYALSCYPFHNAVISRLLRGLPVIVQARSVMSVLNLLMGFLAIWRLGWSLFQKNVQTEWFVLAVTLLNCFSGTIYLPGIFLYTRSYEGKALVLNVVLVVVLSLCTDLWKGKEEYAFRTLFWAMAAGVCFSASSLMALVLCFAALLPLAIFKRRGFLLLQTAAACSPVLIWAACYYLMQHGTLVLRTFR